MLTASPTISKNRKWNADYWGAIASTLCAIHCLVTPIFLLLLPTFGRIWAHPASHWGMALFVVPVAAFTMYHNFKRHGRKWLIGTGTLGVALIIVGAALPYLETPPATAATEEAHCTDTCCPSVIIEEDGKMDLYIPSASVVTTLGGLLLIITHIGNLRCCSKCKA
jgi:hypothetical protein